MTQPTSGPAGRRVTFYSDAAKALAGVVLSVHMHDTSGNLFAVVECDDGRWRQVPVISLQTETPS